MFSLSECVFTMTHKSSIPSSVRSFPVYFEELRHCRSTHCSSHSCCILDIAQSSVAHCLPSATPSHSNLGHLSRTLLRRRCQEELCLEYTDELSWLCFSVSPWICFLPLVTRLCAYPKEGYVVLGGSICSVSQSSTLHDDACVEIPSFLVCMCLWEL